MLHEQTGILVDLLGSDVSGLMIAARTLAQANALPSIEAPNEPNNFPVTYNGQNGGGTSGSWLQVALLQKDLCGAVKNDPELKRYPVFHVSEGGAETDNVGLQFLTIPAGADTLLPRALSLRTTRPRTTTFPEYASGLSTTKHGKRLIQR
jgi:hypothetical protein